MILLGLISQGCISWQNPEGDTELSPAVKVTVTTALIQPTGSVTQSPPLPTEKNLPSGVSKLILWVPPQFDPQGGTKAGQMLNARLKEYQVRNPQVTILVRVKAENGTSSLLESLAAAKAAAPAAVPDVVALSRKDMESAAIKGYIFPIDEISQLMASGDWYRYGREMSQFEGFTYGVPFAGNILLMVYRPNKFEAVPATWEEVFQLGQPLAFPVSDPNSLLTLTLYLSLGGDVFDEQLRPIVQPDILKEVYKYFADGNAAGVFPSWLIQYTSDNQIWEVYRDERADMLVTWSSSFLSEIPADSTIVPIPRFSKAGKLYTIADGWVWAVSAHEEESQTEAVKLIEYLVDKGFLADWSEEAGWLPPRPSSLGSWQNKNLVTVFSQISASASLQPSTQVISILGPVLQDTSQLVIEQLSDPGQASQVAAERILSPEY